MLNKNELLKDVEEKYIPMLKAVDIPNFTKCISVFSGLKINEVDEKVVKQYLLTWAKNKYRFYELLGNKLKVDTNIRYKRDDVSLSSILNELSADFPVYALWLEGFKYVESNKMRERDIDYKVKDTIDRLFPECRLDGCLVTHFFKSYLNAPDELVTRIGRVWENQMVEGTYTISIDPVDMMLASENPYGWDSCYRLETYNGESHADGCLAAILDDSSLITYVWSREGKFSLYEKYDFKKIRYYRMREWISISPKQTAIHFNDIYPGKKYSEDFYRMLRGIVEAIVNSEAIWKHNEYWSINCDRDNLYGYCEFHSRNIYTIKDAEKEQWQVYNERILCPCGCGDYLPGSDDNDDDYEGYEYNGEGFIAENFYHREIDAEYCDYMGDYCEHYTCCDDCVYWNRCNPVCEKNHFTTCDYADDAEANGDFDPYNSNEVPCGKHCEGCPYNNDDEE